MRRFNLKEERSLIKKEYNKIYYQNNKKQIRLKQKNYYKEYYETYKKDKKIYYQNNKEEILNQRKEYYQNNKEEILNQRKEYYENNKEEMKINKKEYYQNNKEEILNQRKEYYENNKEGILLKDKEYYQNNKEEKIIYQTQYILNRLKIDINFKLAHNLRSRLRKAIHNNQKSGSAVRDLGCSVPELKLRLESMFQPGMSWENYNFYGWHIDHIIPLSSFNLQNREEFLKACHYTNLQPLWAEENLKKNNK